ncbi:hypothetical protein HK105_204737 [Polyrhizophydium stewartii]|uniref:Uncharacterized protein n=1 Tax=Polyrhizophydium stewartii TaxID=2732419 RepID=A0ABR4N8E3_9FUNG
MPAQQHPLFAPAPPAMHMLDPQALAFHYGSQPAVFVPPQQLQLQQPHHPHAFAGFADQGFALDHAAAAAASQPFLHPHQFALHHHHQPQLFQPLPNYHPNHLHQLAAPVYGHALYN